MELSKTLDILASEEILPIGRLKWGSNFTFLVRLGESKESNTLGIYKPVRGERPLWDFPPNLAKRERCAWLMSRQLGWELIPPTIIRDGPFGEGSLQLFIDSKPEKNYLNLSAEEFEKHKQELEMVCALDVLINSTDRKSGHILIDYSDKVWAIDNALSFHTDFKLRTVIWDFGGNKIPSHILKTFKCLLDDGLDSEIKELLEPSEISATLERTEWLIDNQYFPEDPGGYHSKPWPL